MLIELLVWLLCAGATIIVVVVALLIAVAPHSAVDPSSYASVAAAAFLLAANSFCRRCNVLVSMLRCVWVDGGVWSSECEEGGAMGRKGQLGGVRSGGG